MPPPKTHTTAVVLIPPGEVWEPIQAIRRLHDRNLRRWMPHITLLYPFRPRPELGDTLPLLRAACEGAAPFSLELDDFRFFRHGERSATLWLAPEPAAPLVSLQERLQRAAPDCDDVRRHLAAFTPHLSVGQARGPRAAVEELCRSLQSRWTPLRFVAGEISIIARDEPPDDVFRVEHVVPLGGGREGTDRGP